MRFFRRAKVHGRQAFRETQVRRVIFWIWGSTMEGRVGFFALSDGTECVSLR